MASINWERARTDEQKEIRIREITGAALKLLDEVGFEKITFGAIAELTDGARSNIYKYFKTREEIFLEILRREIADWVDFLTSDPSSIPKVPAEFAAFISRSLASRPRLTAILGMVYATLEKNVSSEKLREFKKGFAAAFEGLIAAFLRCGLFERPDVAGDFLMALYGLMTGFVPLFHMTPAQTDAMDAVGMDADPRRFARVYEESVAMLLQGYQKQETEAGG